MANPEPDEYLQDLRKLLKRYIGKRKVKIYLFGSRAKGSARSTSDVDIALLPMQPLPENFFADLRELLEESNLPHMIDVVDLSQTDSAFREKILKEGVLWND